MTYLSVAVGVLLFVGLYVLVIILVASMEQARSRIDIILSVCERFPRLAKTTTSLQTFRDSIIILLIPMFVMALYWNRLTIKRSSDVAMAKERAFIILNVWSAFLPARISREDLGDYLEDIAARTRKGESKSIIYVRVVAAIFWTGLNTVSYVLKALRQKSSA